MNIYFHPNKRFFLDTIYCYDTFRGRKIASNLNEIADYIMQKYQGYKIRGVYEPGQLSTDRINNIIRIDETGFHYEKQKNKFVQEEMEVIKEDGDMPFWKDMKIIQLEKR